MSIARDWIVASAVVFSVRVVWFDDKEALILVSVSVSMRRQLRMISCTTIRESRYEFHVAATHKSE